MTMSSEMDRAVAGLSLEQAVGLTSGQDFWTTKTAPGIPSVLLTDGPHGLRKQRGASDHVGLADSVPATCFPPAVGLGSAWDADLVHRVGVALGDEAAAQHVAVLLGPGINIKRSPLCGRNFEYFSEDPVVSGVLGAAWVRGLQSRGVGACVKHFAANNQETDRLRVSSDVDERPLREIYLRAFERVVRESAPRSLMCAYNRVNGVLASEDPWLLTTVLRDEWGFDGAVVSDWGAVRDRVASLVAGLDLEMPANGGVSDAALVAAVRRGELDRAVVDASARRVAALALSARETSGADVDVDVDAHHRLAQEAAVRAIVMLRNEGDLLPLSPTSSVAVVGRFAAHPRIQGAGSSLIHPTRVDIPLDEIRRLAHGEVRYAPGFAEHDVEPAEAERLRAEAAEVAAGADAVVVFLGLPAEAESEGFDRDDIDLPADQLALLQAVLESNPRTAVVLTNGGVVAIPFATEVPAILEGWLLGQGGGGALADVLFGVIEPSGRLTETIPLRLEDTPAFGNFPGEAGHVRYGEGVFVGYRSYDARRLPVAFAFGHGLSYTRFAYSSPTLEVLENGVRVTAVVTNTGPRSGREVVQVYSGVEQSSLPRAPRELRAFEVVLLAPGEERRVDMVVPWSVLAHWDVPRNGWAIEGGVHRFDVGASSRDIRLTASVRLDGDGPPPLGDEATLAEVRARPRAAAVLAEIFAGRPEGGLALADEASAAMLGSFPLARRGIFGLTDDELTRVLQAAR